MSGFDNSEEYKAARRAVFWWVSKWYNDCNREYFKNIENVNVIDTITLMKCLGFNLVDFDVKKSDNDLSKEEVETCKVEVSCGASGIRAVLKLGQSCQCQPLKEDSREVWNVQGKGPKFAGSQNEISEIGSSLLPRYHSDQMKVAEEIIRATLHLLKMKKTRSEPSLSQNTSLKSSHRNSLIDISMMNRRFSLSPIKTALENASEQQTLSLHPNYKMLHVSSDSIYEQESISPLSMETDDEVFESAVSPISDFGLLEQPASTKKLQPSPTIRAGHSKIPVFISPKAKVGSFRKTPLCGTPTLSSQPRRITAHQDTPRPNIPKPHQTTPKPHQTTPRPRQTTCQHRQQPHQNICQARQKICQARNTAQLHQNIPLSHQTKQVSDNQSCHAAAAKANKTISSIKSRLVPKIKVSTSSTSETPEINRRVARRRLTGSKGSPNEGTKGIEVNAVKKGDKKTTQSLKKEPEGAQRSLFKKIMSHRKSF